jgi:hypothetical protein
MEDSRTNARPHGLTRERLGHAVLDDASSVVSTALVADGASLVVLFAERTGKTFDRLWAVGARCD